MPFDPDQHQTFGRYMRGGAPLGQGRTVEHIRGGQTWQTRDMVYEGRTADGTRFKETVDQLGHQTVVETTPDGQERKSVRINLQLGG
ncbi:hypothetical protein MF672_010900 [Actinomadura sp. ATCC 31491]|uniref:Uncharacterized protein n=1 Tax=Actinomadura luzonensis TaxID=2805427 RepID=A0ABT0FPQ9_9ACTN|nr:hypothetical protein [Actinomadura luzonensis]MCK2214295.1 hypothetical protein [Actinomadura luzonensis]